MASSPISRSSCHARSISLPSRSHSIANQFEEHLCRLRSSQTASTSSSSLSHKLRGLSDLYHCVDELLQLPTNQRTLSQNVPAKRVEEVLDGSLSLLDICGVLRDILLQLKGCLQDVQSTLRRRCSGEFSITKEAAEYLKIRKMAKKTIKKCLGSIKKSNKSNDENAAVGMLKDVEDISVDIFRSLLSYIAGVKQSRQSSWSIFPKFSHPSAEKEKMMPMSNIDAVDATLGLLVLGKKEQQYGCAQDQHLSLLKESVRSTNKQEQKQVQIKIQKCWVWAPNYVY